MEDSKKTDSDEKKKPVLGNSFYVKLYILLGVSLILFATYNLAQGISSESVFDEKIEKAEEAARPAAIQLMIIKDSKCKDCFDINNVISSIKGGNVNITKEETLEIGSPDAEILIDKYSIEKIPTFILTGEIDKVNARNFDKRDEGLVFTQLTPPYIDAETGSVLGRVSAMIIEEPSCDKCFDFKGIIGALEQAGVKITSEKTAGKDSVEGRALISKYNLKVLPTLVLSGDLEVYSPEITQGWNSIGSVEPDGIYVTRTVSPPYFNLTTNKVEGLVSMTALVDNTCKECYDPDDFHKPILQRMGVVFEEEKRLDISDTRGRLLINNYKIEKVPTIILEGDVGKYSILVEAWKEVGTVEADGTYIFRNVEVAQETYKNLKTNQIVEPASGTS